MSVHVGTNGNGDLAEPQVVRPADIEQDMNEMVRRKRVDLIMNSQVFREELERIIDSQLNEGYLPASLSALQQVTDILLPQSARNSSGGRPGQITVPVNDIRGVDGFRYEKGEKVIRCKLAAVYRLVDLYGWSAGIYNHITVRLSQDHEHFLLNPFGLQYHEVTASSLLKVDMQGNIVDPGSTSFSFNKAGFVLHSAIHSARPDLKAIIHIHHPPCVAVSAMKCGLLPVSQEAAIVGEVSYHDNRGLLVDPEEREQIARSLGPFNKVLILRNHGIVTGGETIEEALFLMHNVVSACESQIKLMVVGIENMQMLSDESIKQVRSIIKSAGVQVQGKPDDSADREQKTDEAKARKWKIWDLEFEARMRMLDNAGYRTGYLYRQPLLRNDQQPRTKYECEIPPAATSGALSFEEDKWLSPLKKLVDGKKTQDKLRWVNSPNMYQKVEMGETGEQDPKKITKWIQDGSPQHANNAIKIETAHQFAPVHFDPNEFRKKQKEMKSSRLQNKISSGPQSNILEGVTWEEVRRMNDDQKTSDQVVMVGAASKGIIQKDFQQNAVVYKSAYSRNPFEGVTDKEIQDYKDYVAKKQRGEPVDELPEHMRHLILEPVHDMRPQTISSPTGPKSPQSPTSDEEESRTEPTISETQKVEAIEDTYFARKFKSERRPKNKSKSDTTMNSGERKAAVPADQSSRSSREDLSASEKSSKKEKKGKGFRTPSFLKSKKKQKKEKEQS